MPYGRLRESIWRFVRGMIIGQMNTNYKHNMIFWSKIQKYAICFHQANNVSPYSELDGKPFSIIEDRDYTPLEIYQHWVVHTATVVMRSATLRTLAFKETLNDPTLQYFDTAIFLAATTLGKMRGFSKTMSAYRDTTQDFPLGQLIFGEI